MQSGFVALIYRILLGAFAGALTGVLSGLLARIAMRLIVLNSYQLERFTIEGTGTVLVTGILFGALAGALYGALLPFLARLGRWRGIVFGFGIAVIAFGPFLLEPSNGEAPVELEWFAKSLFFALPIVSGIVLAIVVDVLNSLAPWLRAN